MIDILISLLILILIMGLIWYVVKTLPIPEPFRTVIIVIVAVILIIILLSYLPVGPFHWRLVAQ